MDRTEVDLLARQLLNKRARAWAGDSRPKKFLRCSEVERRMRHILFRNSVRDRHRLGCWGIFRLSQEEYRIAYHEARYEAHATLRGNWE